MIFIKSFIIFICSFFHVIFLKFIMALHVFISTVLKNQGNFLFQIFTLSKKKKNYGTKTLLTCHPTHVNKK